MQRKQKKVVTVCIPVKFAGYLFGQTKLNFQDVDDLVFFEGELEEEHGKGAYITSKTQGKRYVTEFMGNIRLCQDHIVGYKRS